jgi:hypothetical protein
MLRSVIVVALAAAAATAGAEIYRYRDPETGKTKLTNIPPPGQRNRPQAAPGAAPQQAAPASGAASTLPAGTQSTPVRAAAGERRFPVADSGFVAMNVPLGWLDRVDRSNPRVPPVFVLRPASGPPFEVLFTPFPTAAASAPKPTPEWVREFVRESAEKLKGQIVEREVPLREFAGAQARGTYFSVTDRAPKPDPGEYKYMTQGMLVLDELRVTFTILTNDGQAQVVAQALEMLRGARRETAAAGAPAAPQGTREQGGQLQFVAPRAPRAVTLPKDDWAVELQKRTPDGASSYYFVTSYAKPIQFSIYLDRTTACSSGETCRTRFWGQRGTEFQGARDVRMYVRNGFHVVQFWLELGSAGGMSVNQANLSAHMYRDGYWIDLRVSRVDRQVPDPAPMLELLDSITVK